MISYYFSNGKSIDEDCLIKACEACLMAIEDVLPDELRTYECFEFIISKSQEFLKQQRVGL